MPTDLDRFPQAGPAPREFALQAWHDRKPALLIAGGIFGASLVLAAYVSPHYKAVATVAVLPAPEFTVRADAGSREPAATTMALDQVMKTETEILGSDNLHLAVLTSLGAAVINSASEEQPSTIARFAHRWFARVLSIWVAPPIDAAEAKTEQELRLFRHNLLVIPAKDSNIITVSFLNRNPRYAAAVVNTLLALYAAKRRELYDDPQLDAIRREKITLEAQAKEAEQKLTAFKYKWDLSDFAMQRTILLQRLSKTDQDRSDTTNSIADQDAKTASIAQQISKEPPTIPLFNEIAPDGRLQLARSALQDMEVLYAESGERYTDGSRLVARLRIQLEARRAAVVALAQDGRSSLSRRGRNASLDQLKLDFQRGITDLSGARSRLTSLEDQAKELNTSLHALEGASSIFHFLEREKASAEDNLIGVNRILSERHLTEAEDALRFANVRVIQPARVPQAAQPFAIYIVVSGLLVGLLAAAGWTTHRFARRDMFLSADALAEHFQVPVIASFGVESLGPGRLLVD